MNTPTLIAHGKTKRILATADPDLVILEAIDRLSAGDAARVAEIDSIGVHKTRQCARLFSLLNREGLPTAYVDQPAPNQLRCHAVTMLPLEFVLRRYPYGSYFKRNPEQKPAGTPQPWPALVTEIFHKEAVLAPPAVKSPHQVSENDARAQFLTGDAWAAGVYTDPLVLIESPASWALFDAKAPPSGEPLLRIAPLLTPTELDTLWQTVLVPASTRVTWALSGRQAKPISVSVSTRALNDLLRIMFPLCL